MAESTETLIVDQLRQRLLKHASDVEVGTVATSVIQHDVAVTLDMLAQCCDVTSLENIDAAIQASNRVLQALDHTNENHPVAVEQSCGQRGRPRYELHRQQLEYLVSNAFSVREIAAMIGVSDRTVKRRLNEYGIKIRDTYSHLSDSELDDVVQQIMTSFPNIGYQSVKGHLQSRGERLQDQRVRQSMRRVDPAGVLFRRLSITVTKRRQYSVRAPLSLWHIDGYHKLIRYYAC